MNRRRLASGSCRGVRSRTIAIAWMRAFPAASGKRPLRTSCERPPATSADCSIRDGAVMVPPSPTQLLAGHRRVTPAPARTTPADIRRQGSTPQTASALLVASHGYGAGRPSRSLADPVVVRLPPDQETGAGGDSWRWSTTVDGAASGLTGAPGHQSGVRARTIGRVAERSPCAGDIRPNRVGA